MTVESIGAATSMQPRANEPVMQVDKKRQEVQESPQQATAENTQAKIQPEELLGQIKALTENGLYSVRFEKEQDMDQLVVKVVDSETDEVVRQIPPEELIELTKTLNELRGNIVDTTS